MSKDSDVLTPKKSKKEKKEKKSSKKAKKSAEKSKVDVLAEKAEVAAKSAAAAAAEDDSGSDSGGDDEKDADGDAGSGAPGYICPLARPLAPKRMEDSLLKLVSRSGESKSLQRGVKEVIKAIRKGAKGLAIIAGDVYPMDIISHLPLYCEDHNVPYVFVSSKAALGAAARTKQPTSVILVTKGGSKLDKLIERAQKLPAPGRK